MTNTYILFLFGNFEDFDDIEFFCLNVLGDSKRITQVKYIIQNLNNIIVILDSDVDKKTLEEDLNDLLDNENIHFYFAFERSHLFMVHIPENMKDIIFKPNYGDGQNSTVIENQNFDLDSILDKIKNSGIDSLTIAEKNFLDNFEN
jgi:signal recognition particle receptor subunit beta